MNFLFNLINNVAAMMLTYLNIISLTNLRKSLFLMILDIQSLLGCTLQCNYRLLLLSLIFLDILLLGN
jgi:hypothetical protein